ncbi:group II intron maturase-specific domain-containing protein [Nonomuraea wenchangensis]|uniref:group II intron maturase-specific domain-containing protein n=1 Tax=Nonomuraea sp. LP-02 TaxID=3097960 RepID=UPI00348643FC
MTRSPSYRETLVCINYIQRGWADYFKHAVARHTFSHLQPAFAPRRRTVGAAARSGPPPRPARAPCALRARRSCPSCRT